jgi:hypothetical protein
MLSKDKGVVVRRTRISCCRYFCLAGARIGVLNSQETHPKRLRKLAFIPMSSTLLWKSHAAENECLFR